MMKTNMPQRVALEGDDNVFEWDDDDEEGAKLEIGDAPGTAGLFVWVYFFTPNSRLISNNNILVSSLQGSLALFLFQVDNCSE